MEQYIYIYIERERERERNQRVKFVLLKDSIGFLYQPLIIVDNHAQRVGVNRI